MSYQSIPLLAGKPFRLDIPGQLLLIDSPGVAGSVDVQLVRNGQPEVKMPNRKAAFRHIGKFDGVILTAAVDSTVNFFLSFDDVNLGLADSSAVTVPQGVNITNAPGAPIPVTFSQQIVPLGSVQVSNTDAQAMPVVQKSGAAFAVTPAAGAIFRVEQETEVDMRPYLAQAVTNVAAAAVTAAASVLLAAAPARRGFRVRNVGANAVALGGAGLTFAGAAVVIQPGETWNENEAPAAAWSVICDAALTSTLNIQTIA
jgi:hypothetical protein